MPGKKGLAIAAFAALIGVMVMRASAQGTPPPQNPPAGAPQTPPPPGGARGQGRGGGIVGTFPAQQRPPDDPAVIARGKTLYDLSCSACHGIDLRGGQLNGPNLLRSQLLLNDQEGELILPIVQGARADKGMPALPLPPDDVKAIATYLHSVAGAPRQGAGGPPRGTAPPPDVLVGDAAAGRAYFAAKCSRCHSATGDLQGFGARFPDAKTLQNFWVSGGRVGGRGGGGRGGGASTARAVSGTVWLPGGEKVEGRVLRYDDFIITLALPDETVRSFRREGESPKVEIRDPLEPHQALMAVYSNKDMRDLTAYLVTLK